MPATQWSTVNQVRGALSDARDDQSNGREDYRRTRRGLFWIRQPHADRAGNHASGHPAWQRDAAGRSKQGTMTDEIEQFRWLLEELRVSLFAQELRTPVPVSVKRLAKLWQTLR